MKRLLMGIRPTGIFHLGHYVGNMQDQLRLQNEYENFCIIADLHCLTTQPEKQYISKIPENISKSILDYLSVGMDLKKSNMYLQSAIFQVYKMNLICEMLATVKRLEKVTNIKTMAKAAGMKAVSFGLLGYPVLQAADILLLRADSVLIGQDESPQIVVAQEIAQRFNYMYNKIFSIPEIIIGKGKILIGLDGKNKMSDSLDNAIYISDTAQTVKKKLAAVSLSRDRIENNPLFIYNDIFNPNFEEKIKLKEFYLKRRINEGEVKRKVAEVINKFLDPFRERRCIYEKQPNLVKEFLIAGTQRVQEEAKKTMEMVQEAMNYREINNLLKDLSSA